MKRLHLALFLLLGLAGCALQTTRGPIEVPATASPQSVIISYTQTPSLTTVASTISPSPTSTVTPTPVAPINLAPTHTPRPSATPTATVGVTDEICTPPMRNWGEEVSPDGLWVATTCLGEASTSFLQVQTVAGDITWIVKLADYSRGNTELDTVLTPFYWSTHRGPYLYVTAPSRFSGCCWIGGKLLLARLDLTNGKQVEIANYIGASMSDTEVGNFSISSDERYIISIPQWYRNTLYVLDQFTWKQKAISINYQHTGAGYAVISDDGQKIILVLREYPATYQGDLTYGSLLLVDLENGSQRKLISGMEFEDTPIPIAWQDADHVILRTRDHELLLLNINTAELTPITQTTLTPVSP